MAVSGIKIEGLKEAQKGIQLVGKFFAGQKRSVRGLIEDIIGDDLAREARANVRQFHGAQRAKGGGRKFSSWKFTSAKGRTNRLEQSVNYGKRGKGVLELFTDLSIAPYGRIREVGGTIRASMSAFRNRKTGQPLLFIPRRAGVSPRDWKGLKFGVDYVLTPQVEQTGSFYMKVAIETRIQYDEGMPPRLSELLGFPVTHIFQTESLH